MQVSGFYEHLEHVLSCKRNVSKGDLRMLSVFVGRIQSFVPKKLFVITRLMVTKDIFRPECFVTL